MSTAAPSCCVLCAIEGYVTRQYTTILFEQIVSGRDQLANVQLWHQVFHSPPHVPPFETSGQDADHSLQLGCPVVTIHRLSSPRTKRSNPRTVAVYNTKIGLSITTRLLPVACSDQRAVHGQADEQLGQSPKLISAKIRSWLSSIMKYLRRDGSRVVADSQSQRLRANEPMSNSGSFVFFVNGSSRFQGQQLLPGEISGRE
jgi:hypothetical protein